MMSEKAVDEFACSLYQEHLSEASFLYEQRLHLLDDPFLSWLDIEAFEERFEAHIDGLVVGERSGVALAVCKQQTSEGDLGELHAAVRSFCRQNRLDLVREVLDALDSEDAERVQAISDALNHELPTSWQDEMIGVLTAAEGRWMPIMAKLIGYRRLDAGGTLLQTVEGDRSGSPREIEGLLLATDDSVIISRGEPTTLIWALGRLREPRALMLLFRYLQHAVESVRAAAALALLRTSEPQTVRECLRVADSQDWPLLPLGLGGGRSAVSVLLGRAADKASPDCLMALGLLGDISAVDTLLAHLTNAELSESAALALHLITGAELYEEVFIPEEIDEDELFEEELEALQSGESLTPPDEEPPGTTITRLSQKPEDWHKWWTANRSRFSPGIRYRNGVPYSPACLLENLESEKSPRRVRQLAYEELVIRYGVDFPFETDMFVVQQKRALTQYAEWMEANGSRFREGQWYFAGQLLAT